MFLIINNLLNFLIGLHIKIQIWCWNLGYIKRNIFKEIISMIPSNPSKPSLNDINSSGLIYQFHNNNKF